MKKLTLIISALALVMGLSQCRKPNVQAYAGDYEGITKDITFTTGNGGDGSKVTIDNDVLKELHYKWEANDVIHVYGSQKGDFTDGQYCGELKLVSAPGSQEGTFEGTLNNVPTEIGTSKIRFYYFGGGNKDATIDLSTQNGMIDNEASSLNKKIVASLDKTITSNTEYSGDLEVLFSIVKFDFNQFGTCDLTMSGTKNNAFNIDAKGNVVKTAGTTTTLNGVTSSSTAYYVAVMPENVTKLRFSGNGKSGVQETTKLLEPNVFYTDNGNSYEIVAGDPAATPNVTTKLGCESGCSHSMGGTVTSSPTPQVCQYGVVYAKTSKNPNPTIDGSDCFKTEANTGLVSGTLTFNVDLVGLDAEEQYSIRAYAIGENGEKSYAENVKTFNGGTTPEPINWNGGGILGASPKTFSVSDDNGATVSHIRFSKGNLQFNTTEKIWRFAEHQFDMNDGNTENPHQTSDYEENTNKWIDLFGWGCTGYLDNRKNDHENWCQIYYQPYSTSTTDLGYSYNKWGYGPDYISSPYYNLTVANKSDWGFLKNTDVENETNTGWRLLTNNEWLWLFNSRVNATNLYGQGKINCTPGVIILPDDWSWTGDVASFGSTWTSGTNDYSANVYSYKEWAKMETAGAVFLPAAGFRYGTSINRVGNDGRYWSNTPYDKEKSHHLYFHNEYVSSNNFDFRCTGYNVRLVR